MHYLGYTKNLFVVYLILRFQRGVLYFESLNLATPGSAEAHDGVERGRWQGLGGSHALYPGRKASRRVDPPWKAVSPNKLGHREGMAELSWAMRVQRRRAGQGRVRCRVCLRLAATWARRLFPAWWGLKPRHQLGVSVHGGLK